MRRVHGGDAVFSPRLAGFVLDAFAGPAPQTDSELDALTPREREVLQHIARGYMYKEIALRLDISPKTVEAHVSSVLRKLQLSSRHELSRWAAERRLRRLAQSIRYLRSTLPAALSGISSRNSTRCGHLVVGQALAAVADQLALPAVAGGHHRRP